VPKRAAIGLAIGGVVRGVIAMAHRQLATRGADATVAPRKAVRNCPEDCRPLRVIGRSGRPKPWSRRSGAGWCVRIGWARAMTLGLGAGAAGAACGGPSRIDAVARNLGPFPIVDR